MWSYLRARASAAPLDDPAEVPVARHLEPDLAVLWTPSSRVQSEMPRGVGRPDATPCGNVPPRANRIWLRRLRAFREDRVHRHAAEDERARAEAGVGEQLAAVERLVERAGGHRRRGYPGTGAGGAGRVTAV